MFRNNILGVFKATIRCLQRPFLFILLSLGAISVYWVNFLPNGNRVISLVKPTSPQFHISPLLKQQTNPKMIKVRTLPKVMKQEQQPTREKLSGDKKFIFSSETQKQTQTQNQAPKPTQNIKAGCQFHDVDPYDPAILKYVYKFPLLNCTGGMPVVVYIDNGNKLRINWTKVNETIGKLDYCEYTRLELGANDSNLRDFKWSRKFLSAPLQLTDEDEQVWVRCFLNKLVVSHMFEGRVLVKPKIEQRCEKNYNRNMKENSPLETMSILIVGIDSMSKQNLIRTMPKTREFIINKLHAKELYKFNKVGDNTYPNVLVLHSGYSHYEVLQNWSWKRYFDELEDKFIWHDYQNAGYRTGMGFDVTWISAYHHLKKGWKNPTFDYYNRPMRLAMDKDKTIRKTGEDCVGEVLELEMLQDYIIRTMSVFNNTRTKPYFIYNFFSKLTHGDHNLGSKGDLTYLEFFKKLERKKILNNTITIFFSDHGTRFGEFRGTYNGKIETNVPFMFFIFPPWFEKKYPAVMETFHINQHRLSTNFDVHKTLKDLLKFDGKTKKGNLDNRAISLFDEIPIERKCSHADIPMEFCNCKTLSNDALPEKLSRAISNGVLEFIINKTKDHRDICALLKINSVHSIYTLQTNEEQFHYYQATISTDPGGAVYEALVKYDRTRHTVTVIGEIVRLNFYRGQDACTDVLKLKLYCYCK